MRTIGVVLAVLLIAGITLVVSPSALTEDAAQPARADDGLVVCPACSGEGSTPCKAHCKDGKVRCPATCLKKDDPGWVPGPEGKTVKHFPLKNAPPGTKGDYWWSTAHIGQLIVYENNVPVDKGVCPTCHGTGLIDCKVCKGTGKQVCAVCKGAKRISKADAEAYRKKLQAERAADAIALIDGRVLHGKVISRSAEQIVIKTEDGKMVSVRPDEIAEKPPSGAAGPAPAP